MSKFNLRGKLTVTVHAARGLANRLLVGQMDPYAVVHLSNSKDAKFKTKVVKDAHQNPVWEQSYIFNLEGKEELLHCNVWHEGSLSDDHIGRLDLSLDAVDLSGTKRWYQLKDKQDFTKDTGEICFSMKFDGIGLPEKSTAYSTHQARIARESGATPSPVTPASAPAPAPVAVSPAAPVQQTPPAYQQPIVSPQQQAPAYTNNGYPGAQQPMNNGYPGAQPHYAPPPQPMYQQPPPQPMYQPPPQPMYQQPPRQPVYQVPQPIYQQPAPVVYAQPPTVVYQPPMQQPATIIYQQAPGPQIIGYWPNGQPRYAGQ